MQRTVEVERTWRSRIGNLLLAIAVFFLLIMLPSISSAVVLAVVGRVAHAIGGIDGVREAYIFLDDNLNLYSAVVYALFGLPFFIWVLLMRWHGLRLERANRRANACAALPQGLPDDPTCGHDEMLFSVQLTDQPKRRRRASLSQRVSYRIQGIARTTWIDAALLGIGMQFVTTFIMVLVLLFLPAAMDEYQTLVEESGITEYGIMWFIATIILPPLVEETGFRGLGLTYLLRAGIPFAVANVMQAFAFGCFHMNITQGIYTFVLALVLGYVAHASGSIVPSMLMHAVYNVMGTIGNDILFDLVPWLPYWVELAIGLVICVVALRSLRKTVTHAG